MTSASVLLHSFSPLSSVAERDCNADWRDRPTPPSAMASLTRGERFLRTPGTLAHVPNAPRLRREELLQPLPGRVSLFVLNPGVRFAHPRLISLAPLGRNTLPYSRGNR